jgi:Flavin containing amine oxidoreductase.
MLMLLCVFQHPVLMLAGEAAHEHYFSTTHGAYETGQKQAQVILDYLQSSAKPELEVILQ